MDIKGRISGVTESFGRAMFPTAEQPEPPHDRVGWHAVTDYRYYNRIRFDLDSGSPDMLGIEDQQLTIITRAPLPIGATVRVTFEVIAERPEPPASA